MYITDQIARVQKMYVYKFSHETIKNNFKIKLAALQFSPSLISICVCILYLYSSLHSSTYPNWFPDRQGPDKSWTGIMEKSQGANTLALSILLLLVLIRDSDLRSPVTHCWAWIPFKDWIQQKHKAWPVTYTAAVLPVSCTGPEWMKERERNQLINLPLCSFLKYLKYQQNAPAYHLYLHF